MIIIILSYIDEDEQDLRDSRRDILPMINGRAYLLQLTLNMSEKRATDCNQINQDDNANYKAYCQWFTAIRDNDVTHVRNILNSTKNARQKQRLLNGSFVYDDHDISDIHCWTSPYERKLKYEHAITAAIVYGAYDVMEYLFHQGADAVVVESNGDNVVHTLIAVASEFPAMEERQLEHYNRLVALFPVSIIKDLLMTDNAVGLRPLEYAACTGNIKLLRAFIETPDIYLTRHADRGLHVYQEYDVTEYETGTRMTKSPLLFLCLSDNVTMEKPEFSALLEWSPFRQWRMAKTRASVIPLILWFVLRSWMCFVYLSIKSTQVLTQGGVPMDGTQIHVATNGTYRFCSGANPSWYVSKVKPAFIVYAIAHSLLVLAFDAIELAILWTQSGKYLKLLTYGLGTRHILIPQILCRVLQHATMWGVLGYCVAVLVEVPLRGNPWVGVCSVLTNIGLLTSLLYTSMVLPVTGYHTHIMAQMLSDLLYFFIFLLFCALPIAHFYLTFVNTNTLVGCITDFNGFWRALYTTFLIMINLVEISDYDVTNVAAFSLAHVLVALLLGILSLNFLIAFMTARATSMARHRHVIVPLNRLFAGLVIERRLGNMLRCYFDIFRNRYLKVTKDNSRVLLCNVKSVQNGM